MATSEDGLALLVGLGNPGREYRENRHNVGFMALAELARRAGAALTTRKFQGLMGRGALGGRKVVLLMPETYMNLSGHSVVQALRFFQIAAENLVVLHDEIDLPFGRLQVKDGGGHGGHNGVRSIVEQLGSNVFRRIRIGVGRPEGSRIPVADYVLSDFYPDERTMLTEVLRQAADAVEVLLQSGPKAAMNKFNGRAGEKRSPQKDAPKKETITKTGSGT